MRGNRKLALLFGCAALMAGVVGCGGDDGRRRRLRAAKAPADASTTEGAKVIDPASMDDAKGSITFCTGKDTSGNATEVVKQFNKANGPGMTVKLVEFPASADEQRNQFIQRQQAKSGDCDVFDSDVIWTAEFASQKWLYDMTPYIEPEEGGLHRGADRDGHLRGQAVGRPGDHRRGVHLLRHRPRSTRSPRPGRSSTPGGQAGGRHRLPGRAVRGPDLRLARARVRGRRLGRLRGRHEGDDQLARERRGDEADGRRGQGRHGAEGRDDLHGARDADAPGRPASTR